ncbi:YoaK family protein [Spirosoma humi]
MNHLKPKATIVAICLSALAGCVDAIGFLQLGGYFVSFMSGNLTQLAVGVASSQVITIVNVSGIIALFIGGTVIGTLIRERVRSKIQVSVVLGFVSCLLMGSAYCASSGLITSSIVLMALAMGAENAALQREGDVIAVTYMTGTLVKMSQRIAYAIQGGKKLEWLPYFLLCLGLVGGGLAGTLLFNAFGLQSLWVATAWAICLTTVTYWKDPFR